MLITLTAVVLASMAALTAPSLALAYNENFYTPNYQHPQWTKYYCVPSSAETELDYINSTRADTTSATQDLYFGQGQNHGKGSYPDSYGVDPRGWAWVIWKHRPPYYSYNDYKYGSGQQLTADYALAWSLHETQKPAGVVVWNGKHAIVAMGYQASAPLTQGGTLQGFWLYDPWYLAPNYDQPYFYDPGWGYGIVANSYYQLDVFNGTDSSQYHRIMFSTNWASATPGVSYWKGNYVLILRSKAHLPSDEVAYWNSRPCLQGLRFTH